MTSDRHAWTSTHRAGQTTSRVSPTCGCGQDLDVCTGTHCPRCGTTIHLHAA